MEILANMNALKHQCTYYCKPSDNIHSELVFVIPEWGDYDIKQYYKHYYNIHVVDVVHRVVELTLDEAISSGSTILVNPDATKGLVILCQYTDEQLDKLGLKGD
jgi:hypothetical protein